jgi:hypothetical protein
MVLTQVEIANELLHGACADSIHDFGISKEKATKKGVPTLGDVLITLPGDHSNINKNVRDEATLLNTLLKTGPGNPVENLVAELASKDKGFEKVFEVNGMTTNTYTVKLLHDSSGNYNIRNIRKTVRTDEYRAFFNISAADPLNILVDAQTVTINELFGHAIKGGSGKIIINNILNREVVNDPAPKTYEMKVFKNSESAEYKIKYDTEPDIITYSSFEETNKELYRNKFFSTLDFCISSFDSISSDYLPKVKLEIINKNKNIVYQTNDPHKTNSIAQCLEYIKKLLGTSGDKHIKCSSFFQCKRSGDWLQALSCFDTGRKYSGGEIQGKITLVTHDRILLWYALFIGIDVIFTGSIPGFGKPELQTDAQDENDDNTLDPGNLKRQKIMLYFGANAESPEARIKRYKALTEAYNKKIPEMLRKKKEYNTWIQDIVIETNREIDVLNDEALALEKHTGLNDKAGGIIRLFWKLTAIHYDEYIVPSEQNSSADLFELEKFVSKCTTIESIQDTIRSKADLLYKSKAYEVNDEYKDTPDMFIDYKRGSRVAKSNEARTEGLCNYLQFRLPNIYIQKLSTILQKISKRYETINKKGYNKEFIINYVVNIFMKENFDMISPIIKEYLKAGAIEKVPDGVDLAKEAINADVEADTPEEVEASNKKMNRHRAFVVSDMNVAEYGEEYSKMVDKLIVGNDAQAGGGKGDSYMLYMCYLYTLMIALGGFETSDSTDYMYYDALTRLVCSSVNPPNYDYNSLLLIPYIILPSGEWDSEDVLMKSKDFKECVRIVSHNVALQSVNRRSGDIPYTDKNNTPNTMESEKYTNKFKELTMTLNKLEFKSRQRYLLNRLSNIIQTLNAPRGEAPVFTGIAMKTGRQIPKAVTMKNKVSIISGGKKRFKKSPRRRTQRKTRRHK